MLKAVIDIPGILRRHVLGPVLQLLRVGATPERLARSIAVGIVIGINPLLGSTTVLSLAVPSLLGLNVVACQLGNHVVYPLQLLLFPVFIRFGSMLFRTEALPLKMRALLQAFKLHPWDTTRLLWRWEWHALVVWGIFAAIAVPLLRLLLQPLLERMLQKLHHEPIVEK